MTIPKPNRTPSPAKYLFIFILCVGASPAQANQAVRLKLGLGGEILGLPAQFGPASLRKGELPTTLELVLSGKRTVIPSCLAKWLMPFKPDEVEIFAEPDAVPLLTASSDAKKSSRILPYLLISARAPPAQNRVTGRYLTFDLSTAELLGITQSVVEDGWGFSERIAPESVCSHGELAILRQSPGGTEFLRSIGTHM